MKNFTLDDSLLGRYERLIKEVVIPYQEKVLKDEIPDTDKSHAIENFRLAAQMLENGVCEEEFYGMVFQDSDVAKWLEAAAYSLYHYPDKKLEKRCDEVIELIGRAQHKDGYLNTYFTVKEPDKRWSNLEEAHELYCAGHMIEAAVAYAECTGKTKLLLIMCRMADHIYKLFIEEERKGYPGHPEIELALMRLYSYCKNEKYKKLALYFIDARGVDQDYFIKEAKKRKWSVWGGNGNSDKEYFQCQMPVREQKKAVGHAVRAVYLYTGMAAVAASTGDEKLKNACKVLWDNIVQCRMYVTGAIGSAYEGEAFTKDYHLPNDTAYAETCASIGLIFFAKKMLSLEIDSKYSNVMERALYNCVLAGMQLDGKQFFYVNPLEVIPGISGDAVSQRHVKPIRPKWFACACCPPNAARLLSSIGNYAWSIQENTVYSHLFIGGTLKLDDSIKGELKLVTGYPYDDTVVYLFKPKQQIMKMTLAIRLPDWSFDTRIMLNGRKADYQVKKGYAYIKGEFTKEDELKLCFDMSVRRIYSSNRVSANNGKVAFLKGPIIYCAEGADNEEDILSLSVKKSANAVVLKSDKLGGIDEIVIEGLKSSTIDTLYSFETMKLRSYDIKLIPYYVWGNRGTNQMRVWLPEL
ncbi:hypothetical protein C8E03_10827 [Lachnotalea glycerini]|nr:beta-L-arabinofuranosidase domain-containing protein [Lachnotalea glycerini]PXV88306.1 hypothetical protein C8E03_10827 [Lachnotalea glycerini]